MVYSLGAYSLGATPMPSRSNSSTVAWFWSLSSGLPSRRPRGTLVFGFVFIALPTPHRPRRFRGKRGLRHGIAAPTLGMMAERTLENPGGRNAGFRVLWRFLPMLWPKGEAELKARVVVALVLVLAGKAAVLVMPFAYKAIIDRMTGAGAAFAVVAGLVL